MLPQLYHAHHSRYLEDLPFWLELAAQVGDPILELGCGTGRVLIPLVQAGYHSVGLDNDLSMLKFLQVTIGSQELHTLLLVAADLCRFNLAEKFPLIILPCNTFSTLNIGQRVACLQSVRRHLSEGGSFAVCVPNPELISRLPTDATAELEDEFIHPDTGNPVQVSSSWRRTKRTLQLTWLYDQLFPDGTVDRTVVNILQQLTTLNIYLSEFENEGLMVRELFGDFDRSPYTDDSAQLIILASRSYN